MGVRIGFQVPAVGTFNGAVWGDEVMAMGLARALSNLDDCCSAEVYDPVLIHDQLDVIVDMYHIPVTRKTTASRRYWWVQAPVDHQWAHGEGFSEALDYYDGFLAASPELARQLMEWGAPAERIHHLPMSCDTLSYRPARFMPELACDAVFCGNGGIRSQEEVEEYLLPLIPHGLAIWGSHWDAFPELENCIRGPLPPKLVPNLYSSAKLVVSVHSPWHRENDVPTSRLAEVLSCGAALVSDALPYARERYGNTIVFCKDGTEMERAVQRLLDNDEERQRLKAKGQNLMLEQLGFQAMAAPLFKHLVGTSKN